MVINRRVYFGGEEEREAEGYNFAGFDLKTKYVSSKEAGMYVF